MDMPGSHEQQNHNTDDLLDLLSSARRMDMDGCPAFNAKKNSLLLFSVLLRDRFLISVLLLRCQVYPVCLFDYHVGKDGKTHDSLQGQ